MEMYGELKPNPFIALGGLVSFYLSYRVVKKIDLSKVFDFLSKREDKTISHQEEPMKKEFSEQTAVKKGNKILFMPKKIFYTVSTLCLLSSLVFVVWWVRFKGDFHFECSPNSIFFNVNYDYVYNSTNTVLVDGIRYNKSDMTLFSGEYTSMTKQTGYHIFCAYNYQNGLKHGYSYVWQKEGGFYDGYYTFRGKYKKGLYHGLIEEWYDNGQLKSRGNYVDGQVDGVLEQWHYDGQLKSEGDLKFEMELLLKHFIEIAIANSYNWNIIMPQFPELQNIELQILKDYAETARFYNYNYDVINPKFPELFDEDFMKTVDFEFVYKQI